MKIIYTALFILTIFALMACERKAAYIDSYVIEKNDLYGLIDSTGNEIVAPRFLSIEPIQKDGVALAIIDTLYTTTMVSSVHGHKNIPVLNIKYGYVTSGDTFLFPKPSYVKIRIENHMDSIHAYSKFCQEASFYGGLAIAQDTTSFLFGYIGLNGDTIIPAKYRTACRFNEGRAAVQLDFKPGLNGSGKWGLINPEGNPVCDFVFNQLATPFNRRALASVTSVNKQEGGAVNGEINLDKNGNAYIDKSKATVIEGNDSPTLITTLFLVDENGKIINECLNMMYWYANFTKDGIAVAVPNRIGKFLGAGYRFISEDGEFIEAVDVKNLTEEARDIFNSKYFLGELLPKDIEFADATRFTEGYAAVNLGRAWIFIDKQLIPRGSSENPIFEHALPFSHGLAGVKLKGKFGYINKNFDIVIPCKYDSCAIAGKNLCRVYGGQKTRIGYSIISYIDRSGKIIWQNVNYGGNYWDKETKKHNWREFNYAYIGKYHWPLFLIIPFIVIIIAILIVLKRHKKKSVLYEIKLDKEQDENNIDIENIKPSTDSLLSEQKTGDADSQQIIVDKNFAQNKMNENKDDIIPSVEKQLDDLLNL